MKKKTIRRGVLHPRAKVIQGKKGRPITVTNTLHGSLIELKISATPQAWGELYQHILNRKHDFAFDFIGSFVIPAKEDSLDSLLKPEIGPHGTHFDYHKKQNRQPFVDMVKIQAALLYDYKKEHSSQAKKVKREDLIREIAIEMKEVFGDYMKGYNLKPFHIDSKNVFYNVENFYAKYIWPGIKMIRSKKNISLDLAYNLWTFHNYLYSNNLIKKEKRKMFDLLNALVKDFLSENSPLFQPAVLPPTNK